LGTGLRRNKEEGPSENSMANLNRIACRMPTVQYGSPLVRRLWTDLNWAYQNLGDPLAEPP
jgi:hypothetical protein